MSNHKAHADAGSTGRNKIGYKIPAIIGIIVGLIFIVVVIAITLKNAPPANKVPPAQAGAGTPADVKMTSFKQAPQATCPAVHDGEYHTCEVDEQGSGLIPVLTKESGLSFCNSANVVAANSNIRYYYTGGDGVEHHWAPGDDSSAPAAFVRYETVHGKESVGYGVCP